MEFGRVTRECSCSKCWLANHHSLLKTDVVCIGISSTWSYQHDPAWNADVPLEARRLVEGLLEKKPRRRLGSQESGLAAVRNAGFFRGIDWAVVRRKRLQSKLKLVFEQMSNGERMMLEKKSCLEIERESCGTIEEGIERDCTPCSLRLEDFTEECWTSNTVKGF